MVNTDVQIIERAAVVLEAATFGKLSKTTAQEYVRTARRIQAAREAAGDGWTGISSLTQAPGYAATLRAAWTRRTHSEVAHALHDMRTRTGGFEGALARLHEWVPEAEMCRPHADHAVVAGPAGPRPPSRSKRHGIELLPADWLATLWERAVERRFEHLDALAFMLLSGCRPAEICHGGGVRWRDDGSLELAIAGVKTTDEHGQPWRRLVVQGSDTGPAGHLLAQSDEGQVPVIAFCSPASLSMGIAAIGQACDFPVRVSAYDIRHQRASDARIAFNGDLDQVAAWMGHSGLTSVRYYGRLPRSAGVRGPRPLAAHAPREIRHVARTAPTNRQGATP